MDQEIKNSFEATLRTSGAGTFEVTVPKALVDYLKFEKGDILIVNIRKKVGEQA